MKSFNIPPTPSRPNRLNRRVVQAAAAVILAGGGLVACGSQHGKQPAESGNYFATAQNITGVMCDLSKLAAQHGTSKNITIGPAPQPALNPKDCNPTPTLVEITNVPLDYKRLPAADSRGLTASDRGSFALTAKYNGPSLREAEITQNFSCHGSTKKILDLTFSADKPGNWSMNAQPATVDPAQALTDAGAALAVVERAGTEAINSGEPAINLVLPTGTVC